MMALFILNSFAVQTSQWLKCAVVPEEWPFYFPKRGTVSFAHFFAHFNGANFLGLWALGFVALMVEIKDMKKTLIIAAAAMLIGSSGISLAGSSAKGASGSAPGTQMNNSTTPTSRGASEFSPGDRMRDSRTTGMSRGPSRGASEFTPGDKMNDARKR